MEKSILFNTDMVNAILENKKTNTRRVIKRTPSNEHPSGYGFWKEHNESDKTWYIRDYTHSACWLPLEDYIRQYSKYQIGDILWVRETWLAHSRGLNTLAFQYRADESINECVSFTKERFKKFYKFADQEKWQPSLFMPKEAARLFLKVTDVKIERLNDMSINDFINEGIKEYTKDNKVFKYAVNEDQFSWHDMPREPWEAFVSLWNGTLKKEQLDMYGWDANPYVFVYEFERVSKGN